MKIIATFALFVCLSGYVYGLDERLSADCLNGVTNSDVCCAAIPDAKYAHMKTPKACGSYYSCENGKATLQNCPKGLYWSVKDDQCVYPDDSICVETSGNDGGNDGGNNEIGNGKDECAPEPTCKQCLTGVFPPELCCRDVKTYHKLNLANAEDCSSYYTCVNDHAVLRQCPGGLHWSVNADRCEWPSDAKCSVPV